MSGAVGLTWAAFALLFAAHAERAPTRLRAALRGRRKGAAVAAAVALFGAAIARSIAVLGDARGVVFGLALGAVVGSSGVVFASTWSRAFWGATAAGTLVLGVASCFV